MTGDPLQGCKLYLARLQALPCRVASSTLQGCNLYLAGLQALPYRVASSTLQGCKLYLAGLQALPCRVVSSTLQGCKVIHLFLLINVSMFFTNLHSMSGLWGVFK